MDSLVDESDKRAVEWKKRSKKLMMRIGRRLSTSADADGKGIAAEEIRLLGIDVSQCASVSIVYDVCFPVVSMPSFIAVAVRDKSGWTIATVSLLVLCLISAIFGLVVFSLRRRTAMLIYSIRTCAAIPVLLFAFAFINFFATGGNRAG